MEKIHGKTTSMMEKVIELLGELPENHKVFVTGAHTPWLSILERMFKEEGLIDVEFVPITILCSRGLSGKRGRLLVDDFGDLTNDQQRRVIIEGRILEL